MDYDRSQGEYIRQVLEAYCKTPGTMGIVRRADRMLAAQLYQRGVSESMIENALVLAAARRLIRPVGAPPLGTIRSLAYFLPVIEEVRELHVSPDYFQYLRRKLNALRRHGSAGVCAAPASPPSARMMALWLSSPFPTPFPTRVTSPEHYWVTCGKRRTSECPRASAVRPTQVLQGAQLSIGATVSAVTSESAR